MECLSLPTVQHLMLVIESMDADSEVRRLSPIALVGGVHWGKSLYLTISMDSMDLSTLDASICLITI